MRETMDVKTKDMKIKPSVKPPKRKPRKSGKKPRKGKKPSPKKRPSPPKRPAPAPKPLKISKKVKTSKPVKVEDAFTLIERQVLFYYLEYDMEMITQQEYYEQITKLGFTFQSVTELVTVKSTEMETFETTFMTKIVEYVKVKLSKVEGLSSSM